MVSIERIGNVEVVSFSISRINALVTEEIKEPVINVFKNHHLNVVINLKGVEYIDSSGFGVLLSAIREARNSYSTMKVVCPEPSVMKLFETLYLHTIFEIYSDLEECLSSFR